MICSFVSAPDVMRDFGAVDTDAGTMEIIMDTPYDVGGFQFNVLGANILAASGGLAVDAGFTVSTGSDTVLGFSFTGGTIPANTSGVLTTLTFTSDESEVCLDLGSGAFVDSNGNNLPISLGDCINNLLQLDKTLNFSLKECYPNPFNPTTTISYDVSALSNVNINIYNINGQLVEVLSNKLHQSGVYNVTWNAEGYTSGVYFVKLISGEFVDTQKIMLIK